jgi:hypothetical protein
LAHITNATSHPDKEPAYDACLSPKEDFLHAGNSLIHFTPLRKKQMSNQDSPSPWNTPFYRRESCPFLGDELLNAWICETRQMKKA